MAKILIIEDYKIHRILLSHAIEDMGHEPIPFKNIESAKAELEKLLPDLFIIDVKIENSSTEALAFIRELLKSKNYQKIPIILVSAYLNKEQLKEALPRIRTDNILEKPFTSDAVRQKIKQLLAERIK